MYSSYPGVEDQVMDHVSRARLRPYARRKFLQGRFLQGGTQGTQGEEDASAKGAPEAPQVEVERRMRQDTASRLCILCIDDVS